MRREIYIIILCLLFAPQLHALQRSSNARIQSYGGAFYLTQKTIPMQTTHFNAETSAQGFSTVFYSSGSSLTPQVVQVGAKAPKRLYMEPNAPGMRRKTMEGPPPDDEDEDPEYDPDNPHFGPVGDGLWMMLIMSVIFAIIKLIYVKKHKFTT